LISRVSQGGRGRFSNDLLLCLVQPWKIPHAKVIRSIELLGKHVIPELKK
jgi:hypothetical protein